MFSTLEGPHCEFESDQFDSYACITCNIDGDHIVGSQEVLSLNQLTAHLNKLPLDEYTRERDIIRETW